MTTTDATAKEFFFMGGNLCLDFTNTVSSYDDDPRRDKLEGYPDLVAWGVQAGVLDERRGRRLLREAAARPREAEAVFERALAVREAIFRIFSASAEARTPDAGDLGAFNAELASALGRAAISPTEEGFAWDWEGDEGALDRMLWPVVRSAADLLTAEDRTRVRLCGGSGCTWLFVDTSKNRSRRWCEMKGCGNRAKSRRHYERRRHAEPAAG